MTVKGYAAKEAKGKVEAFEFDPGPLGPNEVEVRVACCGICHSDIAMIDNDWGWSQYPLVPGHEVVGTIAAAGAEVHDRAIGERVGVGWHSGSCGHCEWCAGAARGSAPRGSRRSSATAGAGPSRSAARDGSPCRSPRRSRRPRPAR